MKKKQKKSKKKFIDECDRCKSVFRITKNRAITGIGHVGNLCDPCFNEVSNDLMEDQG